MRVELTYTKRSGLPWEPGYWQQCPRCDAFAVVDEVPVAKRFCVWCKSQTDSYRCDVCKKEFEASMETLQQFEDGKLVAAMCEPCLDRMVEIQTGMLF